MVESQRQRTTHLVCVPYMSDSLYLYQIDLFLYYQRSIVSNAIKLIHQLSFDRESKKGQKFHKEKDNDFLHVLEGFKMFCCFSSNLNSSYNFHLKLSLRKIPMLVFIVSQSFCVESGIEWHLPPLQMHAHPILSATSHLLLCKCTNCVTLYY